jgi:hypothetical protein
MQYEWFKKLSDGRHVKYTHEELMEDGALLTAQIGGTEIVYTITLRKVKNPLTREEVERRFEAELSKR